MKIGRCRWFHFEDVATPLHPGAAVLELGASIHRL
jgi:hypothetical protein